MIVGIDPAERVYAEALARAAESAGGRALLQECREALERAAHEWRERPGLSFFFLSPKADEEGKAAMLDRIQSVSTSPPLVKRFVRLLLRRNRLLNLPGIAAAFARLVDERLGRVPVTLATALPVPPEGLARWTEQLRAALGKEPVVRHVVRPELLSGALIVAGDVVADGTGRRMINELRRRIVERGTHASQA